MAGLSGFPSDVSKTCDDSGEKEFVNVTKTGCDQASLNVVSRGFYYLNDVTTPIALTDGGENFGEVTNLNTLLSSDLKVGDLVQIITSDNCISEASVASITGDRFTLNKTLRPALKAGDTVAFRRPVIQAFDEFGNESLSSIKFIRDGAPQDVIEDTANANNNRPLPVKLTSVTGDVNITANDLNVQLQHDAAQADSVQLGDGVEILAINTDNEALVHDVDTHDRLDDLLTELQAKTEPADTQIVSVVSSVLPTGASTEAKQDAAITSVNAVTTALGPKATEATLAALSAKLNSLGQKVSSASAPVVLSTEQEAILANIRTALQLLDNAVNANDNLNVKIEELNGVATEAKQDAAITAIGAGNTLSTAANASLASIAAKDFATQTTLEAQRVLVDRLDDRIPGSIIPAEEFDDIQITYITSGNGTGQIGTAQFLLGATLVSTVTLTYDTSNRIIRAQRS